MTRALYQQRHGYVPQDDWQDIVFAALESFRASWWRSFRFNGGGAGLKLPPLSSVEAECARRDASDHYYRPCGHADLRVSARLCEDTQAAIDAAHMEYCAANRKPTKIADLRARLRRRDGDDCWVCHHELSDDCTIEHKVARANGGTWAFDNLALAHRECNRALARLPVEAKEAVRATIRHRVGLDAIGGGLS